MQHPDSSTWYLIVVCIRLTSDSWRSSCPSTAWQGKLNQHRNLVLWELNSFVLIWIVGHLGRECDALVYDGLFLLLVLHRMKCPLAGTNKRFLINTIKNTLPSHKDQDHEQKEGSKEPGQSQDQKETNSKKHRSHSSKRSLHSARSSPPRKRASRDKRDSRASRQ